MFGDDFCDKDFAKFRHNENVSSSFDARARGLDLFDERAKNYSVSPRLLLGLSSPIWIQCHSAEIRVRFKLFSERLEGVKPEEQFVVELDRRRASCNAQIHEMAAEQHNVRLAFIHWMTRRESRHNQVRRHHAQNAETFDCGGNQRRPAVVAFVEAAGYLRRRRLEGDDFLQAKVLRTNGTISPRGWKRHSGLHFDRF